MNLKTFAGRQFVRGTHFSNTPWLFWVFSANTRNLQVRTVLLEQRLCSELDLEYKYRNQRSKYI